MAPLAAADWPALDVHSLLVGGAVSNLRRARDWLLKTDASGVHDAMMRDLLAALLDEREAEVGQEQHWETAEACRKDCRAGGFKGAAALCGMVRDAPPPGSRP